MSTEFSPSDVLLEAGGISAPITMQVTLGNSHLPPVSMEDRAVATQQKIPFNMAHVNSRRGSQSPVEVAPEEAGITELPNGHAAALDMKIMEDSLADASEVFNGRNPNENVDEASVLASAMMDDSLDFDFLNHVDNSNAKEFYVNGENSGEAAQSREDLALQKKLMDAVTANEIFSDPSGMDFLANAGSKSGVYESELARQSLYQNFDPFMGKAASPIVSNSQQQPRMSGPLTSSPALAGARAAPAFRVPYPVQSHTATTDMIAAMQQKQNAMIRRQQSATTDRLQSTLPATTGDQQQPSSWPDLVTRRENPSPFSTMKNSPPPQPANVPLAPNSQQWQTPPSYTSQSSTSSQYYSPPLNNGSGDYLHGTNGDALHSGHLDDDYEALQDLNCSPGGSLVSFNLVDSTPRRPVTLRTKLPNSASANKLYRRSVPAGFLVEPSDIMGNTGDSHEEYSGFPELQPIWENVLATYEGLLRVSLNKLSALQTEASDAKQKEAKAVKDQEEMHRVFVGLHERFETSKGVIATYRTNQETLQRAFDDLNAEFQPVLLENKKMQAAVRLNDMKMRQLEGDLEKKKDEIGELTKIVDDLISKDS